jgi:hypothetical protein
MWSKVVRRTHMYLALFLFPWVAMYALSTLVMNHRAWFIAKYGPGAPPYEIERTGRYDGAFAANADPREIARPILTSLDLEGAHTVTRRQDGAIVITRQDLIAPRRITYAPADRTLVVERMQHRTNALLERFHRRRGYATGYALDTVWAASVDIFIVAVLFWVASGLWMWWEMRVIRMLGLSAVLTGAILFGVYLVAI